ncbi:hypothetical protein F2Q68_00016922 [Brassica cretica]|uniref:UDP-glycosyltransferases domain-containing protein n=1 Tax=Brassica cretica TaxID=69181 RepID=A0A8S9HF85_BRACR|nr:hypothetical protein F2Q68_00016922 [Brassica cretica]
MALFIMKWMDLTLMECTLQGLSFLRASPQDPVLAPRASASEIELDAIIGGGRLVDRSCFTSSLEFVSASLRFWELDSSRDFCVAFVRNVRIVRWNLWEDLEILGGWIVFVVVDHAYRGHGWIYNQSFQVGIAISVSLRFPNTQIEVMEVVCFFEDSTQTLSILRTRSSLGSKSSYHSWTLRETKGILVNSSGEMEHQALKFFSDMKSNTPPVYAVGPILDFKTDDGDEKGSEILRWLDEQPSRSVLFLCFGSMGWFGEKQVREIAVALERSCHRFLWSLRRPSHLGHMNGSPPEEFKNLEEILPEGFLDRTAKIGKIIGWAPQTAVLGSHAIGGFVTHCGWNSILESVWFSVPTAAWPIFAEQQFNAFQMVEEELGLAVDIRKECRRW